LALDDLEADHQAATSDVAQADVPLYMKRRAGSPMTLDASVHTFRLRVIARAQALGNVSQACREVGISRTTSQVAPTVHTDSRQAQRWAIRSRTA
jgi:hypothetical protein